MLKNVILSLVKTPELSTYNLESEIDSIYDNLVSDFQTEVEQGTEGPITLYFGETGIQTIIPFKMMKLFIDVTPTSSSYWNHDGLNYNNNIVLALWSSLPGTIIDMGVWEFYNNTIKVAEVVQNPSCDDEIFCMFILNNPNNWISRFNPSGDFTESISPFVGYVRFYTNVEKEIEAILINLSIVGLHVFKPQDNWSHSLDNGCSYIQEEDIPYTVLLNIPEDFSVERSRMFRFATIANDPFDAILRYWHVLENMFDNLVELIILDFVTMPSRPDKYSRKIATAIKESSCAEDIFLKRLSIDSYNEINTFVELKGLKTKIEATANIVGNENYQFWNKSQTNGLKALGKLLYSFRNAVAHRRENEHWFDRLSRDHETTAKEIVPFIQILVYKAILNV